MNMRPPEDGPWIPLEDAKTRGIVVALVEDQLDDYEGAPLHRTTARAVEAALVSSAGATLPGILLADQTVLVLSWEQMRVLRSAFIEWERLIVPELLDKHGAARACMELPQ